MLDKYINKKGKKLRYGYTTGSCAAAASKAACKMLFTGEKINNINIDTPKGWNLCLDIQNITLGYNFAECSIKKDAGDDPDITNNLLIFAKAEKNKSKTNNKIKIIAGKGIGTITKKGLQIPPGLPAINPVPYSMILDEVNKVLPENENVIITISVPEGEEIAKKTFNPKLGIKNGISILGTTGIVEPMSEQGLMESLKINLSVLKEQAIQKLCFTPGNFGKNFCINNLKLDENIIIKISNYPGFMLEQAVQLGFEKILVAGCLSKLIKIAGGIFYTHSRTADARMEILASNYMLYSNDSENFNKIMNSNTIEQALDYISQADFFNYIAFKIKQKCEEYVFDNMIIETAIFSINKGFLAETGKL